ncbi:ABC-2 type transport system permease protein [Altererythrobacter atlanticus]|jgi:ABC-2 type transport system permease protein|uniref:Inner membrane transport permease YhhJ n=1 Tax=Croceibacterium atlanticum TaxID=1267766 RepID=A0A0F7KSU3_9SPHN|nr:ABC transporter permease [Croceibacterium atlanticum]AKH41825.1 Inner membrane transport permease YhhJ [Croceibacterium atlanticum]MBB5734245.1 ABC-2 type transport system permease protein [Croceibacterium atlanticum]
MRQKLSNIYRLGVKELWSLWRDPTMLVLILFLFTASVYTSASSMPETLNKAAIAVVDEDNSPLSQRIVSAFYPPQFKTPDRIAPSQIDPGLDAGIYTFVLHIPSGFQQDILAGRKAEIQLNTDATRMTQAFSGSGYIQQIALGEVTAFMQRYRSKTSLPVDLEVRARFNPTLNKKWFGGLSQIINYIAMLSIILTGAALIREREHGTIEHLLVMPVTPFEIMASKIWSMGLVVLVASFASLNLVVRGALDIPVAGSLTLFFSGAALVLFATTSMGIFMATIARNMPQFGMLAVLVLLPLQMLSGGTTPRESMPEVVRTVMLAAPTTHFVELGQAILFRGAGIDVVWPQFAAAAAIGVVFFAIALSRFRKTIASMA